MNIPTQPLPSGLDRAAYIKVVKAMTVSHTAHAEFVRVYKATGDSSKALHAVAELVDA